MSLPFYTDPVSKRELNFCNGYLSLLYFWCFKTTVSDFIKFKWKWKQAEVIQWDNWKKSFHWWFGILVQKNLFRCAKRVWKENSIKKQLVIFKFLLLDNDVLFFTLTVKWLRIQKLQSKASEIVTWQALKSDINCQRNLLKSCFFLLVFMH